MLCEAVLAYSTMLLELSRVWHQVYCISLGHSDTQLSSLGSLFFACLGGIKEI